MAGHQDTRARCGFSNQYLYGARRSAQQTSQLVFLPPSVPCSFSLFLSSGAVLFRRFKVKEAAHFQLVVQQYCPALSDQYRGVSPRKPLPRTDFTFSASEIGPLYPIPQHLEMSFLPTPPRKIFFCCLEAPTSTGGETCLCDFQKVYEQMESTIRDEFEEKGVRRLLCFRPGIPSTFPLRSLAILCLFSLSHTYSQSHILFHSFSLTHTNTHTHAHTH